MRPVLLTVLLALPLLLPAPAAAKQTVVVLAFGGEGGESARSSIAEALGRRYEVLHGQALLDACDKLGISMSRGANLAKAASYLGAAAVVGGTLKGGHLALAVYSGKTGQPLVTGTVPAARGLSQKNLGKALTILMRGLAKAPKKMPKPVRAPKGTGGGGAGGGGGGGGGSGSKGGGGGGTGGSGGGGGLVFEPDPVESSNKSQQREEMDENPLSKGSSAGAGTGGGATSGVFGGPPPPPPPVIAKKPEEEGSATPKVYATLGFGTWLRTLEMNQPIGRAPRYSSGATFALRMDLGTRPAAFFTDNFLSNLFLHFRFQQTLGLSSGQKDPTAAETDPGCARNANGDMVCTFGTTLREFFVDFGYDWKILSGATSPHVGGGFGGGMMTFTIDYNRIVDPTKDMPGAAYRFLLLDVFLRWPFLAFPGGFAGAHLTFDYRICLGSGEIEEGTDINNDGILEDTWYGPASTGGINLAIGFSGSWKKIIASVEYNYTRYFQAFTSDAGDRNNRGLKVAGGAVDNQHGIMVNVGYSY